MIFSLFDPGIVYLIWHFQTIFNVACFWGLWLIASELADYMRFTSAVHNAFDAAFVSLKEQISGLQMHCYKLDQEQVEMLRSVLENGRNVSEVHEHTEKIESELGDLQDEFDKLKTY